MHGVQRHAELQVLHQAVLEVERAVVEFEDLTDQVNDFVDARLQAMPWVSISAEVM